MVALLGSLDHMVATSDGTTSTVDFNHRSQAVIVDNHHSLVAVVGRSLVAVVDHSLVAVVGRSLVAVVDHSLVAVVDRSLVAIIDNHYSLVTMAQEELVAATLITITFLGLDLFVHSF